MIPLLLIIIYSSRSIAYGYDSGSDQATCGKTFRSGREYRPPCDLSRDGYCTTAGITYPWQAVRRFVRENQGLMKRMYGDQRHIAVLQAELESNTFDDPHDYYQYYSDNKQETSARLLHDDPKLGEILNTKFVYSQPISYKTKLTMPYFRIKEKVNTTTESNTITTETFGTTGTLEESVTENTTESIDTTTTFEAITTKQNITSEEIVTENVQKKETGEVLFQDTEEPSKKIQVNAKLKGVNACPVKEEVVAPFWANNTRGEVLALLNLYPFEQYVHWEKCTHEHRQMYCREGCRCEQQYRLHRLLAYDPNNECRGIFSDWFRFPSCCVCKCYNIPADFRVTSRSPRNADGESENDINDVPNWFMSKRQGHLNNAV